MLEREIARINAELDAESNKHQSVVEKLDRANEVLAQVNFSELEQSAEDQKDISRKIESAEKDLRIQTKERDLLFKSVEILDNVPCKGSFPECQFICDSHKNKTRLPGLESQISSKDRSISILKNRSASLEKDSPIVALQKANKIKDLQKDLKIESGNFLSKIGILSERKENKTRSLADIKKKIREIAEFLSSVDTSQSDQIELLNEKLKIEEGLSIKCATEIGVQTERIRQLTKQIDEITIAQDNLRVLELLESAFSKKGVPQEIISNALPKINSEISEILDGIAGFTVEIECDDSNSVEIYLNYGDNRRLIELGSGMEKMISSIAIRVALTNISSLPKSSMLIIDEGFGALDDSNLEACARLLTNLKSYFRNILIISHVDAIKDVVDNVIDIGWEDGFARVSC